MPEKKPKNINDLIQGHKKFRSSLTPEDVSYFNSLVTDGQKPSFFVISCSDSRVDPYSIMDCSPGDLFVVRNVANLVPPCELDSGYHGTSAALEFAVCVLEVKHIIILGHTKCGGIKYIIDKLKQNHKKTDESPVYQNNGSHPHSDSQSEKKSNPLRFVDKWMNIISDKKSILSCCDLDGDGDKLVDHVARLAMLESEQHLMSFPWVREKVEAGKLDINTWQFDLSKQTILGFDKKGKRFCELA